MNESRARPSTLVVLFATTVFLSAFLLSPLDRRLQQTLLLRTRD